MAVAGSADFEQLDEGLRALGQIGLFLREGSPVFAYDPALTAIIGDGALVVTVDRQGQLGLPFVDDGQEARMLAGIESVQVLEERADGGKREIKIKSQDGVPTRV